MKRTICALLVAGCGGGTMNTSDGGGDGGGGGDLATAPSPVALACTDAPDSVYAMPSGLPAWDPSHRGDVVKCARVTTLTAGNVSGSLATSGWTGAPVTNGVTVYKIAYRTQRVAMGGAGTLPDGLAAALVLIPDNPKPGPLVVVGHGTVGVPAKCAPSHDDLTSEALQSPDVMALGAAGYGYVTISTDYAGFGTAQADGWLVSEDEAHSLLDATRAMKNVLRPSALPGKVVLVGHSQGGHAVLSAQALAKSYGLEGELVGVAAFAPVWLANRTWGAALALGLDTTQYKGALAFQMLYFYSHGELFDGPGKGTAMYQPAKAPMIQTAITTMCLGELEDKLKDFGQNPFDYYDSTFANDLGNCGIAGSCSMQDAMTWEARWKADRPAIDGAGAPIVIWHGQMDTTITPDRAQCGFDKLAADLKAATNPTATLTLCSDATADHGGVVRNQMAWVDQWIDARANGKPEPPTCPAWKPITCATPPPNMD